MAFRLRRGTNAQRTQQVFQSGELVYVTDYLAEEVSPLWIGDGTTLGGIAVNRTQPIDSIGELSDVDITTAPPTNGQVLKWNGTAFVPADDVDTTLTLSSASIGDLNDVDLSVTPTNGQILQWNGSAFIPTDVSIVGSGIVEGSNYRINVVGDDSSIMLDTSSNTFTGNFIGDGSQLFLGSAVPGYIDGATYNIGIASDDDIILVDHQTSKIDGEFVGIVTGVVQASLLGDDSSIIIDHETNTIAGNLVGDLTGNVTGNVTGDVTGDLDGDVTGDVTGNVTGSVFANDSSLMIDAINNRIVARDIIGTKTFIQDDGSRINLEFNSTNLPDLSRTFVEFNFSGTTTGGDSLLSSRMFSGTFGTFFTHDPSGVDITYPESKTIGLTNTGITYGSYVATAALDIRGDAVITGGLTADVTGSLFSDSSTILIDSTDSRLMVENINVTGITNNAPADTNTVDSWLEVTVNGATKYIPLYS